MDNEGIINRELLPGNLGASIKEIRGGMFYMIVSYDNGYDIKISGELFPGARFIAYKSSINKWEQPHESEILTAEMVEKLISDIEKSNSPGKVNIIIE